MENVVERAQLLSLPEFERSGKYWREALSKKTEETRLPYSFFQTLEYEQRQCSIKMDPQVSGQLEKASKGNLEAMYILLVASYRVLLFKYMGQSTLEIGMPVRKPQGQESAVFTQQLLPVIHALLPEGTFRDLLKGEKEKIAAAYQHQHYPLEVMEDYKGPKTAIYIHNIHASCHHTSLDFAFEKTAEGLYLHCTYNGKLFSADFIHLFATKYLHTIGCLLSNAGSPLEKISILGAGEEDRLLNCFNSTAADYPFRSNLVEVFQKWVSAKPDAKAVVYGAESLTFRELDEYSDRIAHYLVETAKIKKEEPVGMLLQKSQHAIACMLGILKAGGAYLPVSPRYPAERIRMVLNDARLRILLSSKGHIKLLNKLQWECPHFETLLCIDSMDCHAEPEESTFKNELNNQKLWEHVGETATDDIEGGGWQNSYTGENLSRAEMNEYRDNILKKLTPLLHQNARVLEIGCASGISMFELAPKTALYYGTDLSRVIIEKNQQKIASEGITNIKLKSLAAHEIDQVEEKDFDLVIINSVIQCFEGHNYFRAVLSKVVKLMKDSGLIFIGDIMDEDSREAFTESLNTFKKRNMGKGLKVKTDFSNEIFYARRFFEDLRWDIPGVQQLSFSDKIHTIENELTKYRYDALITIDKSSSSPALTRHKFQHALPDLQQYKGIPFKQGEIKAEQAAYVIYTSGSTGKPKGVIATHKNVLRTVINPNYVRFEEGDRVLQTGPMEFDASTFEIWAPLANGLPMHIIDSELLLNAERLKAYIAENKITTTFVATAAFHALLEQEVSVFDALKFVLIGGEAMSARHANKFFRHNTRTKVVNGYGPTENTFFSTTHTVCREYKGPVPIGKPLHNSSCYVLDQQLQLVPQGAEGLLYVGGDGVTLGYLHSPELTQQRFIPNPFKAGETLYHTGDLVRWNAAGELEFLGRVDSQVKIRGFRIELSEIENELLNISGIREARVVVKKSQQEDKSLLAYFTAAEPLDPADLASILADKLPDYMIPSAMMQLESMPLNSNGKLDVHKLPDPVLLRKLTYEAAANDTEKQLVEIWKEVLELPEISVHDNFFDLGGHSLKAMKVLHKLSRDYELKLTTLFKFPTIRQLSQNLVFKKGNLQETFKRLQKEPLSATVIRKAEERKAWYREMIQKDTFQVPGEELDMEAVLLTGSTGYLGIHLLFELLTHTTAQVFVLIRAEHESAAQERLLKKLSSFFEPGFYEQYAARIVAVAGEMERTCFGLEKEVYLSLADKVDTIVNPAANVKHYGLEEDYRGNTMGVEELVKLAKCGRPKRIHHVSTAGVSFGQDYIFSEYDRVQKIPDENNTIYLQSKLDAEHILFRAMEAGVEASIYRVGNLVFNNKTGKFQENTENNAFYMLLRSFINLGIMPDMHHKFYDFSFINTTAESIVKFAKQKALINEVFHVFNGHTYSLHDIYQIVIKPNFPHVRLVSIDAFTALIMSKFEDPEMKEFIEHIIVNVRILEINEGNVMLVSERSQGIAERLGIQWHPLNDPLAKMMVAFGKENRFW